MDYEGKFREAVRWLYRCHQSLMNCHKEFGDKQPEGLVEAILRLENKLRELDPPNASPSPKLP